MELARSISLNLVDITGGLEKVGNDSVRPFSPDSFYLFVRFKMKVSLYAYYMLLDLVSYYNYKDHSACLHNIK